ncbi:trichohyalin-like [Vigna radiata var. radiata]|uniref:Trichohyalin-like n=1 Tax=Vigna radiata var. radiata TaxID=3916 RepID=A0A1S3UAK0_VIGRR|nr:trichohyalin-like [Vigna radiata var. radiata]
MEEEEDRPSRMEEEEEEKKKMGRGRQEYQELSSNLNRVSRLERGWIAKELKLVIASQHVIGSKEAMFVQRRVKVIVLRHKLVRQATFKKKKKMVKKLKELKVVEWAQEEERRMEREEEKRVENMIREAKEELRKLKEENRLKELFLDMLQVHDETGEFPNLKDLTKKELQGLLGLIEASMQTLTQQMEEPYPSTFPSSSSLLAFPITTALRVHVAHPSKPFNGVRITTPRGNKGALIVSAAADGSSLPAEALPPAVSEKESGVSVDKLPLESKVKEREEQKLRMKLAKKIRLRRKRLLRKCKLRKKGRWPPSKMKKLKNV